MTTIGRMHQFDLWQVNVARGKFIPTDSPTFAPNRVRNASIGCAPNNEVVIAKPGKPFLTDAAVQYDFIHFILSPIRLITNAEETQLIRRNQQHIHPRERHDFLDKKEVKRDIIYM